MIYLRDLSPSMRADYERSIRNHRPDLAKILDDNNSPDCESETDIIIGDDRAAAKYEIA